MLQEKNIPNLKVGDYLYETCIPNFENFHLIAKLNHILEESKKNNFVNSISIIEKIEAEKIFVKELNLEGLGSSSLESSLHPRIWNEQYGQFESNESYHDIYQVDDSILQLLRDRAISNEAFNFHIKTTKIWNQYSETIRDFETEVRCLV